ncbi:MAG: hypothetical protein ABIB71_02120 [Candidatus Woesearchaeota archaeon]
MGKEKYLKDVETLLKKSSVVDFRSIQRVVRSKKKIKQYAKHMVRNMLLKGKLKRLTKGFYTTHDNPSLAVFCFTPAYLGLQDAMSFHGLWEQETIPVIVTAKKIRPGIREIMGVNVLLRRISRKYLFGFEYYQAGDVYFPYSDLEKTLIDMVHFRQKLSKESVLIIKSKIQKKKLLLYLKAYPKRIRNKVLLLIC